METPYDGSTILPRMLYRVTVHWLSAAGAPRETAYDVERDTQDEAEDAAIREVQHQPGRRVVRVKTEEIGPGG